MMGLRMEYRGLICMYRVLGWTWEVHSFQCLCLEEIILRMLVLVLFGVNGFVLLLISSFPFDTVPPGVVLLLVRGFR